MKKTMRHNVLIEIAASFSRYIAIFAIVMLGVGFFAGLRSTSAVMKDSADSYFDAQDLMDLHLRSTMGFTADDAAAVRKTSGIRELMATYTDDVLVERETGLKAARIMALPDGSAGNGAINMPKLIQGRLPKKNDECLVDSNQLRYTPELIGSTITISGQTPSSALEMLKNREFTVTGIAESPAYISLDRGTTSVGSGSIAFFLMIPEEGFNSDYYTDLYAAVEGALELSSYSDAYGDLVGKTEDRLKILADEREDIRYEDIMADAREKLGNSEKALTDARAEADAELAKAREDIDSAVSEIERNEEKLQKFEQELLSAKAELAQKEKEFTEQTADSQKRIDSAAAAIVEGKQKIARNQAALDSGYASLEAFKQQIAALNTAGKTDEAAALSLKAAVTEKQLKVNAAALDRAKADIAAKDKELEAGKAVLDAGKAKAYAEFEKARKDITASEDKIEKGRAELAEAKSKLSEGRKEYDAQRVDADKRLQDSQTEIDKGRADVEKIKKPVWYVLDRNTNPGFVGYGADADRINAISEVFPVFFFLVAALVCLTTMTRMVEEQRAQIGTFKALGYGRAAIVSKYLFYAGSATILGSAAGLTLGFLTFPFVIYKAYGILYTLPPAILEFNVRYALISSLLAIASTFAATFWACWNELAEVPAELLRPRAPAPGKRVLLERFPAVWNRLSFLRKVTFRNLFRYKKRFFMTVLGVGGCTALLLTGFGLRDSIMGIVAKQFGGIDIYDVSISLKDTGTSSRDSALNRELQPLAGDSLYVMPASVDVKANGNKMTSNLIVPEKAEKLEDFIVFRDRATQEAIPFPQPGKVILSEKLAIKLKVRAGDKISLNSGGLDDKTAIVGSITENYVYNFIYMTAEDYTAAFGKNPEFGQVLVKLSGTPDNSEEDEKVLSEKILKMENVSSVNFTAKSRRDFDKTMKSLNSVVILIIICANLLAFVVLYNLTNVNITERLREIATIKVLGFYDNEVSAYVYRENFVLTFIGTLLGLVGGIFLHRFVVQTAEVDIVMFERNIEFMSYVWSALLTLAFTALVNFVMYYRLRGISMVESLKSAE